mmetsp:Transcript_40393/g.86742  ORF Transcript_40393/g.86742 Transcript_40393/m.86742 type:complete len:163 (-) Transcript_40393:582-1070(-)
MVEGAHRKNGLIDGAVVQVLGMEFVISAEVHECWRRSNKIRLVGRVWYPRRLSSCFLKLVVCTRTPSRKVRELPCLWAKASSAAVGVVVKRTHPQIAAVGGLEPGGRCECTKGNWWHEAERLRDPSFHAARRGHVLSLSKWSLEAYAGGAPFKAGIVTGTRR